MDRKRGRFTADYETNEIFKAVAGWQEGNGTTIEYYRFDAAHSQVDDIYDEGTGVGRVYHRPYPLPVTHVTHTEGRREDRPEGRYVNDSIHVSASFDQLRKVGLTKMDINTAAYLTDRMVYDNKVFTVTNINILGQIQDRDIMVGIDGTQVSADELVNDPQFKKWSA